MGAICMLFSVSLLGFLIWVHLFLYEKKSEGNLFYILFTLLEMSKFLYLIIIGFSVIFFGFGVYLLFKKKKNKAVNQ
jgi:hypothetical protein